MASIAKAKLTVQGSCGIELESEYEALGKQEKDDCSSQTKARKSITRGEKTGIEVSI